MISEIRNVKELDEAIDTCTKEFEDKISGTHGKRAVLVCGGTGCLSNDSDAILQEFKRLVEEKGLANSITVNHVGCFGFCSQGPFVKIYPEDTLYCKVKVKDVIDIVEEDLVGGNIVERLLYVDPVTHERVQRQDDINFYKRQKRISLHGCSLVNPDFLELNKGMELEGYNKNEIRDDFSLVKFLNYLKKETQIRVNSISDEELDYIKRIATLYGLKEKDIGGILTECFIPEESKGNKVDQAKLKNIARTYVKSYQVSKNKTEKKTKLNSTSDIAALIKYYESISPNEFLKSKQNGVEISEADLNLIETLSFNVGFSNGMINALLDQVLKTKNGELSKNYVLKIATTLVRKGCKNTLDCLEEFNKKRIDSSKKEVISTTKNSIKNSNESTQKIETIEEEDDGKSFFDEE